VDRVVQGSRPRLICTRRTDEPAIAVCPRPGSFFFGLPKPAAGARARVALRSASCSRDAAVLPFGAPTSCSCDGALALVHGARASSTGEVLGQHGPHAGLRKACIDLVACPHVCSSGFFSENQRARREGS
jgi:hypothetical protein